MKDDFKKWIAEMGGTRIDSMAYSPYDIILTIEILIKAMWKWNDLLCS